MKKSTLSFLTLTGLLTAVPSVLASDVKCASVGATKDGALAEQLLGEGFDHLGFISLNRSFVELTRAKTVNVEAAVSTLDCLEQISRARKNLSLRSYDRELALLLKASKDRGAKQAVLRRYAFRTAVQILSKPKLDEEALMALMPTFTGSSVHVSVMQGLIATKLGKPGMAAKSLEAALRLPKEMKAASELERLKPELKLTLARHHYAMGNTAKALAEYESLYRIGKPMQDALIESGWTRLKSGDYAKAIGLSHEMENGKLVNFFTPEASSIGAIAFVENCRYVESKRMIDRFSVKYAPVAKWLAKSGEIGSLYEAAIARAEGAVGAEMVPEAVWSMWSTSEFFRAEQAAIKASFKEERMAGHWISSEVSDASVKARLLKDLAGLASARETSASAIESHLEKMNRSMAKRIAAESERLRFVSIETNRGAGRDLVYLNASPEAKQVDEKWAKNAQVKSKKGTLSWGKAKLADPKAEMWIDEIGGYEAAQLNRCGLKSAVAVSAK